MNRIHQILYFEHTGLSCLITNIDTHIIIIDETYRLTDISKMSSKHFFALTKFNELSIKALDCLAIDKILNGNY